MNERKAIEAELIRRGVLEPLAEQPSPLDERKAIEAELMRRGALPSPEESQSPSAWTELGRGLLSGIAAAPMREAADEAEFMINPQIAEDIRAQASRLSAPAETPLGRVAHHAGEFAGGVASFPTGGGGATPLQIVKGLAKSSLMGGTAGAVSGVAQELGVPPLAADIGASIATPGILKAGTSVGSTVLSPLSPALRNRLASKEASTILQDVTQGVPDAAEAINVPRALQKMEPRVSAEEAGSAVRESLVNTLEGHKKVRSEITRPLYEKIESIQEGIYPKTTQALLEKKLETAKGPVRETLAKIQKELHPNVKTSAQDRRNQKILEEYKNVSPQTLEMIKAQFPVSTSRAPRPIEIENTIKYVSDEISKAYRTGASKLGRELEEVKTSLETDFKTLPEGLAHRQKYAELSKPVSEIEEHRALGAIVEKKPYGKGYVLGPAEIPEKVINTSIKSVQDSQDLLKQIGKDKKVVEALHGHINNEILTKIVNDEGRVSTSKLETWRKSHPGAFILYPQLETKLKNITNAQFMVNQILAKSKQLSPLEAVQMLPLTALKKLTDKIVGGGYVLNFVSKLEKASKIQKREQLLQQALEDPQVAKGLLAPLKDRPAMERLARHLMRYGPGVAKTMTLEKTPEK